MKSSALNAIPDISSGMQFSKEEEEDDDDDGSSFFVFPDKLNHKNFGQQFTVWFINNVQWGRM